MSPQLSTEHFHHFHPYTRREHIFAYVIYMLPSLMRPLPVSSNSVAELLVRTGGTYTGSARIYSRNLTGTRNSARAL
jgi:hypothetical protein